MSRISRRNLITRRFLEALVVLLVLFPVSSVGSETSIPMILGQSDKTRSPIESDPNVKKRIEFEMTLITANHLWFAKDVEKDDLDHYPEAVLVLGGNRYCSGVLVTRTAVVTAGHCVCSGVSEKIFLGLDRNDK